MEYLLCDSHLGLDCEQNAAESIDHTEDVVVRGVNTNGRIANGRIGRVEEERVHRDLPVHGVNTARIQCACGLGILGSQGDTVIVDVTLNGSGRMMVVGLLKTEIGCLADLESVISV